MNRRRLLRALGTGVLGIAAGCNFSLEDGVFNLCLPGPMPPRRFVKQGFLTEAQAEVLSEIRGYNPLLFDFVLKRSLVSGGQQFTTVVFESRRLFESKPIA